MFVARIRQQINVYDNERIPLMSLSESKAERILGIVFAVLGLVLYFVIIPWQIKDVGAEFPTPRSFPNLLAGLLVVLGAALFVSGVKHKDAADQKVHSITKIEAKLVVITLLLMVLYVISLYFVPYIPATVVVLALMIFIYGQRSPVKLAAASVAVPVIIYLAFTYILKFNMP